MNEPSTPTNVPTHPVAQVSNSVAQRPQDWNPMPQRYGRFALQRFHAKGGLGEVHVATDEELRRDVALKRMQERCANDPSARRRFLNEAEITARLEHPGIVPIYGLVQDEHGQPCYAMRFIEGESLAEAIKRFHNPKPLAGRASDGPITKIRPSLARPANSYDSLAFRQLLQRFISVCQTIGYAHSKNVIHRDIKPANIMLGPFGETLVVDWGLARELASRGASAPGLDADDEPLPTTINFTPSGSDERVYTQAGQALGTLGYMAPEQAAGRWKLVSPASDIFSLGATLYELLTGQRPIRGPSHSEALQKALTADFPAPRKVKPAIPKALEAICLKAMAAKLEERYASAKELAADLENWLADERVRAWTEPWHVSTRRYLRRRKTAVAVLAVLAVVVPAAAVLASWLIAREQAQAEIERRTAQVKEETAFQLTNYLVRLFESADPIGLDAIGFHSAGDRSDTHLARRLLDRGASLVREHLQDQPVVRAALLDAMGNSYRNVGALQEARDLVKEAFELRRSHLGEEHLDTVASLQSMAHLARERGDYAEADRQYREVIQRREKLVTANHLLVAETKFYLGWMTFHRPWSTEGPQSIEATSKEAEHLLLEALKVRQQHLPPTHRDIGHTLAGLASIKISQGNQTEFAIYAGRAAEVFRQNEQGSTIGSAVLEALAAEAHRHAGRLAEAEASYLKLLALLRRHVGDQHPLTVLQMGNLAGLYKRQGNLAKAEKTTRDALELVRQMPALRNQPVVLDAIIQLADHVRARDPRQSTNLLREALQYACERPSGNEDNLKAIQARLSELEAAQKTKQ